MTKRAFLVYQAGIANVFEVECYNLAPYGRDSKRIMQGAFSDCETFCRGLAHAGWMVHSAHCNEAGDIKDRVWDPNLEGAPFFENMRPVKQTKETYDQERLHSIG